MALVERWLSWRDELRLLESVAWARARRSHSWAAWRLWMWMALSARIKLTLPLILVCGCIGLSVWLVEGRW